MICKTGPVRSDHCRDDTPESSTAMRAAGMSRSAMMQSRPQAVVCVTVGELWPIPIYRYAAASEAKSERVWSVNGDDSRANAKLDFDDLESHIMTCEVSNLSCLQCRLAVRRCPLRTHPAGCDIMHQHERALEVLYNCSSLAEGADDAVATWPG